MLNRRHAIGVFVSAAASGLVPSAFAKGTLPFDLTAFETALGAGKPILIEVSAPWCPVCKAQDPILSKLKAEPRFKELVNFNIDFDTQKDLLAKFGVQKQSTLIAFKAKREVSRSTGDTNADSIAALVGKTI